MTSRLHWCSREQIDFDANSQKLYAHFVPQIVDYAIMLTEFVLLEHSSPFCVVTHVAGSQQCCYFELSSTTVHECETVL